MGYISVGRPLVDSDNDGTVDGILNRINAGSGMDITYSASTGILTLAVDASELGTGTGITFSSGAPSSGDGSNGDLGVDYTNGNLYRKTGGAWEFMDQFPSLIRTRMFTSRYLTSGGFASGKFTVDGEHYFNATSFPNCTSAAEAETYLNNLGWNRNSRIVFTQRDDPKDISVFRATSSTIYTQGDTGFSGSGISTSVGLDLEKESGQDLANDTVYIVEVLPRMNIEHKSNGSVSIQEMNLDNVTYTFTGDSNTATEFVIANLAVSTYRSAKYHVQITNTTDSTYQVSEVMLVHNGSTSTINEYGVVYSDSILANIITDVNSGNARVILTNVGDSDDYEVNIAVKALTT
jgi:hypothetical protein